MTVLLPGRSYAWPNTLEELKPLYQSVLAVDQLYIDGRELGVKEWRLLVGSLYARPHGAMRVVVLTDADQISEIVQNMLLKALEEPPSATAIVLLSPNTDIFLPTLRSRLQILPRSSLALEASGDPNVARLFLSPVDALAVLQQQKDRIALTAFLRAAGIYLTDLLLQTPSPKLVEQSRLVEQAQLRLAHNCNQKIVVDDLVLQIFFESGN